MDFQTLPSNSRSLLKEIVTANNPVSLLCEKFSKASSKEDEELRGILHELIEKGFVKIQWADNIPYRIYISNSARTYEEQLAEYYAQKRDLASQSIVIGNNNRIINSSIAGKIESNGESKKKGFYEKHPVICGFLISLIAGIVLLFSFWDKIIAYIEGVI